MARSRGTGLKRDALWDGTRKAWPLLCSASSHPLRTQFGGRDDVIEIDSTRAGAIRDTKLIMKYLTIKDISEQMRIKPATI
jgi:hypothetical protein